MDYEPSDGKIHIRTHYSNAPHEPAFCGKRDQTTLSEAYGHYGPGGDGHEELCPACWERWSKRPYVARRLPPE